MSEWKDWSLFDLKNIQYCYQQLEDLGIPQDKDMMYSLNAEIKDRETDKRHAWNYKQAYHLLMEHWDSLQDETKTELSRKLWELGL